MPKEKSKKPQATASSSSSRSPCKHRSVTEMSAKEWGDQVTKRMIASLRNPANHLYHLRPPK